MSVAERLAELGLTLPPVTPPLASYVPAVRAGHLVYTAGQLPMADGRLVATGKVGTDVTPEQAADCARTAALNALAAVADAVGGLEHVARVVKVVVFVSSTPDFTGQAAVANGASELIGRLFAESGAHARSSVGVASLPLDAPVEVEMVVQIAPRPLVQPVVAV